MMADIIVDRLLASAGVVALVVDRIEVAPFKRAPTYPAISVEGHISRVVRAETLETAVLLQTRVQVDSWALTAGDAEAVNDQVFAALHGWQAVVGDVHIKRVELDASGGQPEPELEPNVLVRRIRADYFVTH